MKPIDYPASPREDVADVLHGVRVADPYRWLGDARDPAVRSWMDAQDGLTRGGLDSLPARAGLAARLRALIYVESVGIPARRGSRIRTRSRPSRRTARPRRIFLYPEPTCQLVDCNRKRFAKSMACIY